MKPKILLVEDEYALQTTIKAYLDRDYHVLTARTATQAIASLKETHFKVMLVDLGLPDTHGLEVIKAAIHHQKKMAVLALTGDQSPETVKEAIEVGIDDYLVKPVMPAHLHDRIKKAILKRTLADSK